MGRVFSHESPRLLVYILKCAPATAPPPVPATVGEPRSPGTACPSPTHPVPSPPPPAPGPDSAPRAGPAGPASAAATVDGPAIATDAAPPVTPTAGGASAATTTRDVPLVVASPDAPSRSASSPGCCPA